MTATTLKLSEPHTLSRRGEGPNPIDIHVGSRLRLRRTLLGISQEKLGESVGITFQQLQKYERGANRVSASRLFNLAQVLNVSVAFFFDDMPTRFEGEGEGEGEAPEPQDMAIDDAIERISTHEALELVRAYHRITDLALRRRAFELIQALGSAKS